MLDPTLLEQALLATPAPPLAAQLPQDFVLPRYGGRSILNIPPTIGHLLGVTEGWQAPPLDGALWRSLGDGVERVIFLLVDGIGWRRIWRAMNRLDHGFIRTIESRGGLLHPITTISPATTSVATTTLWCDGSPPAAHGMLGYTFLMSDYSAVLNMLFWKPDAQIGGGGEIMAWGLDPEEFLPVPSIAQRLAEQDIVTVGLKPGEITHSPLSRMQSRGAKSWGYMNDTDMWLRLREWLVANEGQKAFCSAYYPDFDTFSHKYGPDEPSWDALWQAFQFHLTSFMESLPASQRRGTMLLLSADHGHVTCPPERHSYMVDHPDLMRNLTVMAGGEPRHVYLYPRARQFDEVYAYCNTYLAQDYLVLTQAEALQGGLYGDPTRVHPETVRRLGDIILLSRGGTTFWGKGKENMPIGMHGALDAEEMMVPLLAMRLD
jgi:hypothetical protein